MDSKEYKWKFCINDRVVAKDGSDTVWFELNPSGQLELVAGDWIPSPVLDGYILYHFGFMETICRQYKIDEFSTHVNYIYEVLKFGRVVAQVTVRKWYESAAGES